MTLLPYKELCDITEFNGKQFDGSYGITYSCKFNHQKSTGYPNVNEWDECILNVIILNNGYVNASLSTTSHYANNKSINVVQTKEYDLNINIDDNILKTIKYIGFFGSDFDKRKTTNSDYYFGYDSRYVGWDILDNIIKALKRIKYNCVLKSIDHPNHLIDDPNDLQYIENPSDECYVASIKQNPEMAFLIPKNNLDLMKRGIEANIKALKHLPQTEELCRHAVSVNVEAFDYIYDVDIKNRIQLFIK